MKLGEQVGCVISTNLLDFDEDLDTDQDTAISKVILHN